MVFLSVRITAAKAMAVQTMAVDVIIMIMAIVPAVVMGAVPVMAMAPCDWACHVNRVRRLVGHNKGERRRTPGFLMRMHLKH